ncbi:hypothetical protein PGT21_007559 [Puccinia graminis f. sp. tritici]|uniref:Uncharacterized protein n=1 Tax=Puccinia graminis f. sp. tritici TaxID=56615 RepID=A0A5B0N024_PUCGR|nr:hypothetical protein PGT21_007559 [Puccinia graminis f. sp. tritici]KAA1133521.1 hypothetical protein PGTUg99_021453 [Puccinia graminis f. sp. tritici]
MPRTVAETSSGTSVLEYCLTVPKQPLPGVTQTLDQAAASIRVECSGLVYKSRLPLGAWFSRDCPAEPAGRTDGHPESIHSLRDASSPVTALRLPTLVVKFDGHHGARSAVREGWKVEPPVMKRFISSNHTPTDRSNVPGAHIALQTGIGSSRTLAGNSKTPDQETQDVFQARTFHSE